MSDPGHDLRSTATHIVAQFGLAKSTFPALRTSAIVDSSYQNHFDVDNYRQLVISVAWKSPFVQAAKPMVTEGSGADLDEITSFSSNSIILVLSGMGKFDETLPSMGIESDRRRRTAIR